MNTDKTLACQVLDTIIDHYKATNPEFLIMVYQLVKRGHSPADVESLIQAHCPPGSAVAAHAYLLAESFHRPAQSK